MHLQFLVGGFGQSHELGKALEAKLDRQTYRIYFGNEQEPFLQWIGQNRHRVDCLVFELTSDLPEIFEALQARDILLPLVIVEMTVPNEPTQVSLVSEAGAVDCRRLGDRYHPEILCITCNELSQLEHQVHQAINQFLNLPYNQVPAGEEGHPLEDTRQFLLSLQQQRLAEKLRERLGYLGIYYKRNPDNFLRNLTPSERAKRLEQLRASYRSIILSYFSDHNDLNAKIDDFVTSAFFTDASVSKVVEIHMELMDSFSKQLKLEGRSEEILLDYRLTLIDVIAHLCEMYRRSIPREG